MPSVLDPQTALIVVVPEAEPVVGAIRARFDPSAALGVPAHVTLLHPFMAPAMVDAAVRGRLESIAAATTSFDYRLAAIHRFPGTLYLTPEPAARFVALTQALVTTFPAWLPYGGRHPAVIPHLTVAQADPSQLDAIESELRAAMGRDAVAARCTEIVLIENASGRWRTMHAFSLRGTSTASTADPHITSTVDHRPIKGR